MTYLAGAPDAATVWAKLGGFTSPNKNVKLSSYSDPLQRRTAAALANATVFRFDMSDLQPAAFGATAGQGEWKLFQDFVSSSEERQRHRGAAREGGRGGVQEVGRVSSAGVTAEPPVTAAPPSAGPGRWRGLLVTATFLAPAVVLLGVWIVYPAVNTFIRSFYDADGSKFVGIDNYKAIFTTPTITQAIKNNAIWVLVVPALVTSIGLVFAVLTERVSWRLAFRTAVFMPMAVSLFAAGVIWRIMDQQDPSRGAINAGLQVIHDQFKPPGPLQGGEPSTPNLTGTQKTGYILKTPLQPGGVALLGLTGIAPTDIPKHAEQAKVPTPSSNQIGGVVWRDFKPGGGTPGKVDSGRARPAGRDARAEGCERQEPRLDDVAGERRLRLRQREGRDVPRRDRRGELPAAVRRRRLARPEADHAVADHRVHLGLGRLRDGRHRGRASLRSRATRSRPRAPTALPSGKSSSASPCRCSRRCSRSSSSRC